MSRPRNYELEKKILELAKEGIYLTKIASLLNVPQSLIHRKIKLLEKEGFIESYGKCPKFYKVTKKDYSLYSSLGVRKPKSRHKKPLLQKMIRLHAYKLKIPILRRGRLKTRKVDINNWTKEYAEIKDLKVTLELTTKNAILHFHETDIPRRIGATRAIAEFSIKGSMAVCSYLGLRGFKLDLMNQKVISQHLASQTAEEIDQQIAEGTVIKKYFGRPAHAYTGEMQQEAAAWIDKSKGISEIETNDDIYEELLLEMPRTVALMKPALLGFDVYNKNIKKHLNVLDEMSRTLKDIRNALKK